jgi:Outer membrane protein and related peptidoglycan-associated (lipo)proteins
MEGVRITPLRILGYTLHPIGWILREGIFRPISYGVSSTEFTRSFFGYRYPYDFRESVCFNTSGAIPNCNEVPPVSMINAQFPKGAANEKEVSSEAKMVDSSSQVYFPDVAFDFNKSSLNALGKGRVRQIAQLLSSVPTLEIVVEGHADPRGSDEYNKKLGDGRANAVIKELTELGIDASRLSPVSRGESEPIFTEEADWAYAVNRRVKFSVK